MIRLAPSLLSIVMLSSAAASRVHADDWLAVHPTCAYGAEARRPGLMAIVYPRAGLPALVHAGGTLVARVRVPSALTPPPGVQRDRALRGWSAELRGRGASFADAAHRYGVRVTDVRPDGHGTMIYRASLPVPAWAAPGTYELRMTAPGGAGVAEGAVRILPAGAEPRVAFARAPPSGAPDAAAEAIDRLPVDVLVVPAGAAGRVSAGAAVLELPAPVAVRVGAELWSLGGCDDRYVRFDRQLASLGSREGRRVRAVQLPDGLPAGGYRTDVDHVFPGAEDVQVRMEAGRLTVVARAPIELSFAVPDDRRSTRVTGGSVVWWPGSPVPSTGFVPTLVGRLSVDGRATVSRGDAPSVPTTPRLIVAPDRIEAGVEATVTGPTDRVFWSLDEDVSAVGRSARHAFRAPGRREIHALVIDDDGVAGWASVDVEVHPRARQGCGASGRRAATPPAWILLVLCSLCTIRRLAPRRTRAENLVRDPRCEAPTSCR